MLPPQIISTQKDHERRIRRQEAKSLGPTLGEFYGQFLGAPGLRGLWYPGSLDETGAVYDRSGQGRVVAYNGNPTLNLDGNLLLPYMDYDGVGDFHSRPTEAGLSITGTNTTIAAAYRGLTLGGIVWLDTLAASAGLIGKWNDTGNQRGYLLYFDTGTQNIRLALSTLGTSGTAVSFGGAAPVAGAWYFVLGRFMPSVKYGTYQNGTWAETAVTVPPAIFANTAALQIGAFNAGTALLDGRWKLKFLAAAAWPDEFVEMVWQRARVLLGV